MKKIDSYKAKAKINEFFFNYFKKTIIKQIELSGRGLILGDSEYWRDESSFDDSITQSSYLNIGEINRVEYGGIQGSAQCNFDIYKFIYDAYKIPLNFKFYADNDDGEDFVCISSSKDLKKIKSFSIEYLKTAEGIQIDLVDALINDFKNQIFLCTLRG